VLERNHLGEFENGEGRQMQRTELTEEQARLLKRLGVKPPPRVARVEPASPKL